MDTSKVSQGELIAAVGGVLLIISLFLDWFSSSASIAGVSVSASGNAFDVFSGMHIIMLIVGIAAVALAGAAALDAASNVPRGGALVLALLYLSFAAPSTARANGLDLSVKITRPKLSMEGEKSPDGV